MFTLRITFCKFAATENLTEFVLDFLVRKVIKYEYKFKIPTKILFNFR